jgi:hypothetical protein
MVASDRADRLELAARRLRWMARSFAVLPESDLESALWQLNQRATEIAKNERSGVDTTFQRNGLLGEMQVIRPTIVAAGDRDRLASYDYALRVIQYG